MPVFSIIIVNFNTVELTKNCIDSIFKNLSQPDFEVIVIDNCSSDRSAETLASVYGDKIKLIKNGQNAGFGAANNAAAAAAAGEYLFFLNSDTLLRNNCLARWQRIFSQNSKAGAIAPKLLLADGSEQPFAFGSLPSLLSFFKTKKKAPDQTSGLLAVEWLSGAALIIRKDLFRRLEGFDEKFFMYFEDIDLCMRIKSAGFELLTDRETKITHLLNGSPSKARRRKSYYYRSQDYFFKKHYGLFNLLLLKVLRFPLRLINLSYLP